MSRITRQQWANLQWAKGRNPIRLFKNVYLVRHESTYHSRWPIYLIKIFKDYPLDKQEEM
jgi:hypothetical protein